MSSPACAHFRDLLLALEQPELSTEQLAHLTACDECAAYYRDVATCCSAVHSLSDLEPPSGMIERLNEKIREIEVTVDHRSESPRDASGNVRGSVSSSRARVPAGRVPAVAHAGIAAARRAFNSSAPFIASALLLIGYDVMSRGRLSRDRVVIEQLRSQVVEQQQSQKDLQDKSAAIFESLVDRIEASSREIDALAGALRQAQEVNPAPSPKELEGPDTLESFGMEELRAPSPPPPAPAPGVSDFLRGAEVPETVGRAPARHYRSAPKQLRTQPHWSYVETPDAGSKEPTGNLLVDESHDAAEEPFSSPSPAPSPVPSASPVIAPQLTVAPTEDMPDDAAAEQRSGDDDLGAEQADQMMEDRAASERSEQQQAEAPSEESAGETSIDDGLQQKQLKDEGTYLDSLSQTEGISFRPSTGMWESGYVPAVLLTREQDRLEKPQNDLSGTILHASVTPPLLHRLATPSPVGLTAPDRKTIEFGLRLSHTQIDGPSRLLAELDIASTASTAMHRPVLSFVVAIDLARSAGSPGNKALWRTAQLLRTSLASTDRMTVILNPCSGGAPVIYEPAEVTFGLLSHLAEHEPACSEPPGSLADLLSFSVNRATGREQELADAPADVKSPFEGRALVVLTDIRRLSEGPLSLSVAIEKASASHVPLSIAVRDYLQQRDNLPDELQPYRSSILPLSTADESEGVVERIIKSSADVVARSLEIQLALAPGVKLVDVIGSHPLSKEEIERSKTIRRIIGRALDQTAGIKEAPPDEMASISFSIPYFHASDAHAIILDLWSPGPGPVLSARIRYKDLIGLKNSEVRLSLAAESRSIAGGRENDDVFRNVIRRRLVGHLRSAARALESGDGVQATQSLGLGAALLQAAAARSYSLDGNTGDGWAVQLLREYRSAVRGTAADPVFPKAYLIHSLRFAADRISRWSTV